MRLENKFLAEELIATAEDILRANGVYYITGEISDENLIEIHQDILLKIIQGWANSITIILNSPGGSCSAGWSLIDLILWGQKQGVKFKTTGMGSIFSMATYIIAAGNKGCRIVSPNAILMVHSPWIGETSGNLHDLIDTTESLQLEHQKVINFLREHSKYKNEKKIKEIFLSRRELYLTPTDALSHGIIDGIT